MSVAGFTYIEHILNKEVPQFWKEDKGDGRSGLKHIIQWCYKKLAVKFRQHSWYSVFPACDPLQIQGIQSSLRDMSVLTGQLNYFSNCKG